MNNKILLGLLLIVLLLVGCGGDNEDVRVTAIPQSTSLPTPTEPVETVARIALNSGTVTVEDWKFLYTYGSDTKPPKGWVYTLQEKVSKDLYIGEIIVTADDLKSITHTDGSMVILTKSGREYVFPTDLEPAIPDQFLTDDQYVFEKKLYLIGSTYGQKKYSLLLAGSGWFPEYKKIVIE